MTVGVVAGAVALGTIVTRLSGIGVGVFRIAELLNQIVFGTTGVAFLGGAADRRRAGHRDRVV